MKTTVLKFFTLSVAIFAFSTISFGQGNTDLETVTAGARIITPINLTLSGALDFGDVVKPNNTAFTVTVNSTSRTSTGGATFIGETYDAPDFSVTGNNNEVYYIVLGGLTLGALPLTGTNSSSNTLDIKDFTINGSAYTDNFAMTLDGSGEDTFTIGATLDGKASTASDTYQGTFTVTVNYN